MAQKRQKAISLSDEVIDEVQRFADDKEWSWSKTAAWLINLGLSQRDVVEELADAHRENERLLARLSAR